MILVVVLIVLIIVQFVKDSDLDQQRIYRREELPVDYAVDFELMIIFNTTYIGLC